MLRLANLIHTKLDPPDFPPTERLGEETPAEKEAFENFVNMHFPRRKFAALREAARRCIAINGHHPHPVFDQS